MGLPGRRRDGARDLVLVGGGHTHVQVLRRFAMRPPEAVGLTVVLDRPDAVYSGMVPGFVAADYGVAELEIDVAPLARRARARVVLARATRIDPSTRRIELEGRPPLPYDIASLDVGSSVRGLDLPGVREFALATRPIGDFVARLERCVSQAAAAGGPRRLAIVGGGAAGLELALTLRARLGREVELTLLTDSPDVLPGSAPAVVQRARHESERHGIALRCGVRVRAVEKDAILIDDERLPCELAVWATGAAPPPLVAASPLPRDSGGFVRVDEMLRVVGSDDLFAVGDCASLDDHPWVPKAGVYAVRQGPVLEANLRARLAGRTLRRYRPQRDFLTLLNLGGRRALGTKWGRSLSGQWVWWLKDAIDRRFVRRFRVLEAGGRPARGFPSPEAMGMEPMECGGCAAKLGASALERALDRLPAAPEDGSVLLGLARPDDAAALELPRGDLVLATLDAFRAFTDDPWLVGRVAAVNAASDVFAKGGRPRHALALVSLPETEAARAEETLFQVLSGVRAALDPLGVSLVGGHSTRGDELFVGLAIGGALDARDALLRLDGARPGDRLVLSKALGTGVVLAADMLGCARGRWLQATFASMLRSNSQAAAVARAHRARAGTDVSGFGLAGHLGALLRASRLDARLDLDAIPALPGALALLARGFRSSFHHQNTAERAGLGLRAIRDDDPGVALLFDPQTSGGLLFAVAPERADDAVAALRDAGEPDAALVGELVAPRADGGRIEPYLRSASISSATRPADASAPSKEG